MSRFLSLYEAYAAASTDAPQDFGHAVGLSVLSTICCGRRWLSNVHPNLYIQLVAGSSKDRKSYSIRLGVDLLRAVEPDRVGPEDYTPEALTHYVANPPANNPTPPRNKILLPIPEFGNHLATAQRSYAAGLSAMLTNLYDGSTFVKIRVGKTYVIEEPRVGMLAGVAFGMLERYADPLEWVTGFFNRICWVHPTSRRDPFVVQPPKNPGLETAARVALQTLRDVLDQNPGVMAVDPAAEAYYAAWASSITVSQDPAVQASRERLLTSVWKAALVYQVDDDPWAPVGALAIQKACAFADKCWAGFLIAYGATSGSHNTKLTKRLWQVIANAGPSGIKRRDLCRAGHIPVDRVMELIKILIEAGVIVGVQVGDSGKTADYLYKAVIPPAEM